MKLAEDTSMQLGDAVQDAEEAFEVRLPSPVPRTADLLAAYSAVLTIMPIGIYSALVLVCACAEVIWNSVGHCGRGSGRRHQMRTHKSSSLSTSTKSGMVKVGIGSKLPNLSRLTLRLTCSIACCLHLCFPHRRRANNV